MPVEVGRVVVPPDRAALSQAALRLVNEPVCGCLGILVVGGFGLLDRAAGVHQSFHQPRPLSRVETRIAHPPQLAVDHEIAPVGRYRVLQTCHLQMKGFPPVTATVVPDV
jgi:hypothetical protein